jgi:Cft2 family RNA processing exonuclease
MYNKIIEYALRSHNKTVCFAEKPQSISKNRAYRLSKTSMPLSKTLLTYLKKQGSDLKSQIFITARRAQRCLRQQIQKEKKKGISMQIAKSHLHGKLHLCRNILMLWLIE